MSTITGFVGGWKQVNGGLNQVSVGNALNIYGTADNRMVYRYHNNAWIQVPGALKWVAVGGDGEVLGVSPDNVVYRLVNNELKEFGGSRMRLIAVGSRNHIVGLSTTDDIWKWNGARWEQIPGKLDFVDVGADGAMWGLSGTRTVRWNGSTWVDVHERMATISVASANMVWAVNATGNPYRWTGSGWELAPGTFRNVSVGIDATLFGVDNRNNVYTWELTPAASPVVTDTLTVISYNTHLFGGSAAVTGAALSNLKEKLKAAAEHAVAPASIEIEYEDDLRAQKIVQKIRESNADIVALQEVWAYSRQKWFADALAPWYPFYFYPADSELDPLATSGLLLLSKHKLTECLFTKFSDLNDDDAWSKKGVIAGRVFLADRLAFAIGTSHAGCDMGGPAQPNIEQIARNTVLPTEAALMLGDFNVHASKYAVMDQIMARYGCADVWVTQQQKDGADSSTIDLGANTLDQFFSPGVPRTDRSEGHYDRLDYAYLKPHGTGTTVVAKKMEVLRDWKYQSPRAGGQWMDLSDHYPIRLTLACTIDTGKALTR